MINLQTTKAIVAAYLSGDVEGVLRHLADDVEWEYGSINNVPWYRLRRGRAEVVDFFRALEEVEIVRWQPKLFLGEGNLTVVVLDSDYTVRSNGRRVVYEDCVLLLHFDANGKVKKFGHRVDLLAGWLAYHDKSLG